jgi:hypothetical protein
MTGRANMTSTKKPSWRDHLEVHPAADQFPMMPPDEMKALPQLASQWREVGSTST